VSLAARALQLPHHLIFLNTTSLLAASESLLLFHFPLSEPVIIPLFLSHSLLTGRSCDSHQPLQWPAPPPSALHARQWYAGARALHLLCRVGPHSDTCVRMAPRSSDVHGGAGSRDSHLPSDWMTTPTCTISRERGQPRTSILGVHVDATNITYFASVHAACASHVQATKHKLK
jgi:hypothetical protein